jgi:hypothetical protein
MGSSGMSSHRRLAEVTRMIYGGWQRDWPRMPKPRAKEAKGSEDKQCGWKSEMARPISS